MKKKDIKKLTKKQMLENLKKLKKDLFNFRFQKVNGQIKVQLKLMKLKNNSKIKNNVRNKSKCLKKY